MGILPKETKLLVIYEDRIMEVQLLNTVFDLDNQQRITVNQSSFSYFEFLFIDFTFKLSLFNSKTSSI